MSRFGRMYLLASAGLLLVGAALHLVIIAIGPEGYAFLGAPAGLVAMVGTGSLRPAISCIVMASLLSVAAAYGCSVAQVGLRLPFRRLVVSLIAAGLFARGILLPVAAALRPEMLRGLCGQCQSVNGFVVTTSVLCLVAAGGYAVGAWRRA